MTPAELLEHRTGSTERTSGTTESVDVMHAPSTGTAQDRREMVRRVRNTTSAMAPVTTHVMRPVMRPVTAAVSLRLVWTIGLNGRLTCDVRASDVGPCATGDARNLICRLSLKLPSRKVLGLSSDSVSPAAASMPAMQDVDCHVAHVAELSPQQQVISLQFEADRCATIDIFQRDAQSTPLIFTDLPSVLGLRGGTYVLTHVELRDA